MVHNTTKQGRSIELAKIIQPTETLVYILTDDGTFSTDVKNITGWNAIRPDIAKVQGLNSVRVVYSTIVKVRNEEGNETKLNIGGWYVKPPE